MDFVRFLAIYDVVVCLSALPFYYPELRACLGDLRTADLSAEERFAARVHVTRSIGKALVALGIVALVALNWSELDVLEHVKRFQWESIILAAMSSVLLALAVALYWLRRRVDVDRKAYVE